MIRIFFFFLSVSKCHPEYSSRGVWMRGELTTAPGTEQSACLIVYLAPFCFCSTKNNFLHISVCYSSQAVKEYVKVLSFSCSYLEKEEKYASHACKWDKWPSAGQCAASTACILTSGMPNSPGEHWAINRLSHKPFSVLLDVFAGSTKWCSSSQTGLIHFIHLSFCADFPPCLFSKHHGKKFWGIFHRVH